MCRSLVVSRSRWYCAASRRAIGAEPVGRGLDRPLQPQDRLLEALEALEALDALEDLLVARRSRSFWRSSTSALPAACSRVSRSRWAERLPAKRMSGAAYAACVEKARLRRMNGYGSKWNNRIVFPTIQMMTMTVWITTNVQLPRNRVTRSATRAPVEASSYIARLTGCRERTAACGAGMVESPPDR
jgi:hypothetical protein